MKKAEIIKNGNVNLKPIKSKVHFNRLWADFIKYRASYTNKNGELPGDYEIIRWAKLRIEKELNSL